MSFGLCNSLFGGLRKETSRGFSIDQKIWAKSSLKGFCLSQRRCIPKEETEVDITLGTGSNGEREERGGRSLKRTVKLSPWFEKQQSFSV